ncbi:hypothetical protein LQV63_12175 [Paenibacillus profundus]|uniref:Uncharacterized protein n=1 Tax=Paenibacillus profundus TaxID=1173085 RepID=A0ABS8YG46_9BACL|nr:hypothetical protein [Paenibacillus profundus]
MISQLQQHTLQSKSKSLQFNEYAFESFPQALEVPVHCFRHPKLAEATVANEDADLAAVGRGMLKDSYWAMPFKL